MKSTLERWLRLLASALFVLTLIGSTAVLTGCSGNDGPFENAGEEIDEAAEEVEDEIDDATDG